MCSALSLGRTPTAGSWDEECQGEQMENRGCAAGPCPPLCPQGSWERRLGDTWLQGECQRWSVPQGGVWGRQGCSCIACNVGIIYPMGTTYPRGITHPISITHPMGITISPMGITHPTGTTYPVGTTSPVGIIHPTSFLPYGQHLSYGHHIPLGHHPPHG